MKPVFYHPDKVQVLGYREWIRQHLPTNGLVAEDIDLILMQYGSLIGRQPIDDGRFMLVEIKAKNGWPDYAQRRVFHLMDRLLRKADPDRQYYLGYYVVHWNYEANEPVAINRQQVSSEQFNQWAIGQWTLPSLFDRL